MPGHKYGRGLKEFTDFVGQNVMLMDLNGMEDLDNANNPIGVIYEAEKLLQVHLVLNMHTFGKRYNIWCPDNDNVGMRTWG